MIRNEIQAVDLIVYTSSRKIERHRNQVPNCRPLRLELQREKLDVCEGRTRLQDSGIGLQYISAGAPANLGAINHGDITRYDTA